MEAKPQDLRPDIPRLENLLQALEERTFDVETLSKPETEAIIKYLYCDEGMTRVKIADLLHLTRQTVTNHLRRIEKKKFIELQKKGISNYELASRLMWKTELVQAKAVKENDWKLYFGSELKLIDALLSLGVVYHLPPRIEQTQTEEEKEAKLREMTIHLERVITNTIP